MKDIRVGVFEQIGSNSAVASEDGEAVFERITKALDNDVIVNIDFLNVELITSTFLNAAIGQLYSKYDNTFIKEHVKISNMTDEDMIMLKKVVDRAKEYFKNKEQMENSISEVFDNE